MTAEPTSEVRLVDRDWVEEDDPKWVAGFLWRRGWITNHPRLASWAVPALPALLALLVAGFELTRRQFWRDEFATWVASTLSLRDLRHLVDGTDAVIYPYYLFMHVWIGIFGDSTLSMRVPSLLSIAAAAGFTTAIGRRLYGTAAGVFGGCLFAILPSVSRYGQEARPYAAVIAAATLATLLLLRAMERPSVPRWVAYGAAVTLIGWLHLVALLLLLAHAVFVATSWRRDWRPGDWLVAVTGGLLPVVPLVWLGAGQTEQIAWIPSSTWSVVVQETVGLAGSPEVGAMVFGLALLGCWPVNRRAGLLAVWALAPVLVLWVAAPVLSLVMGRYLLFTLPAWCLLAAVAVLRHAYAAAAVVAGTAQRWKHTLPVAVAVICLLIGLPAQRQVREIVVPRDPDLRGVAAVLGADGRRGEMVAYHGQTPWWSASAMDFYLPAARRLPTAFAAVTGRPASWGPTCQPDGGCLEGLERIWLVNVRAAEDDPLDGMNANLRARWSGLFEPIRTVPLEGVTLTLWRAKPPPGQ